MHTGCTGADCPDVAIIIFGSKPVPRPYHKRNNIEPLNSWSYEKRSASRGMISLFTTFSKRSATAATGELSEGPTLQTTQLHNFFIARSSQCRRPGVRLHKLHEHTKLLVLSIHSVGSCNKTRARLHL